MLNTEAAFAVGAVVLFILVRKIIYGSKTKVQVVANLTGF